MIVVRTGRRNIFATSVQPPCAKVVSIVLIAFMVSAGAWSMQAQPSSQSIASTAADVATSPVPGAAEDHLPDRQGSVDITYMMQHPPDYPAAALKAGVKGLVIVRVLVGAGGSVKQVLVEKSTPPGVFDVSAITAAKSWHYNATIKGGKTIDDWMRLPIEFRL